MGEKHVWTPYLPTFFFCLFFFSQLLEDDFLVDFLIFVHMFFPPPHATDEKSKIGIVSSDEGFLAIGSSLTFGFFPSLVWFGSANLNVCMAVHARKLLTG